MKLSPMDILDGLEQAVDQTSIASIVGYLAQVAYDKAEHVTVNWQDDALAKRWQTIAEQLDAMKLKLKTEGDLP